jgi:hypothetical protein
MKRRPFSIRLQAAMTYSLLLRAMSTDACRSYNLDFEPCVVLLAHVSLPAAAFAMDCQIDKS